MAPIFPCPWDKPVSVPESVLHDVDPAVLRILPEGTKVVGISSSGTSFWARTGRIDTVDGDGKPASYFIKVMEGADGRGTVTGEFRSMTVMHAIMPELVARPVGCGAYDSVPDTYFQVTEFVAMGKVLAPAEQMAPLMAELHRRSAARRADLYPHGDDDDGGDSGSPAAAFGWDWVTFGGNKPATFRRARTWEECFRHALEHECAGELATHGPDEELEDLERRVLKTVVPRLLRPLETGGRRVVPCLVHGDLWEGNMDVNQATGRPIIFDATPIWAHNEYELGPWTPARHSNTHPHAKEYLKHYPPAEPVEEVNDRVTLYRLNWDMHGSSLYPGTTWFRPLLKEYMKDLLAKYEEGYEAWAARQGLALDEAETSEGEYVLTSSPTEVPTARVPVLVASSTETLKAPNVVVSELSGSSQVIAGTEE